jgi:DNA-binding NarL/FixJ family response regulator
MAASAANQARAPSISENRLRLLLAANHGLLRASLSRLLASEDGFEIAGECGAFPEALEIFSRGSVDLVLLDFDLEGGPASEFVSAARQAGYQGRVLILAETADPYHFAAAVKLGASGVFLKSDAPDRLVQAIRHVAAGTLWFDPKTIQLLADQCVAQASRSAGRPTGALMEEREQKVLRGILDGFTSRQIGASMGLSESNVKNILQALFAKAGVRKRSQLVRLALEASVGNGFQVGDRRAAETAPSGPGGDPALTP